jgi:hypothetical protein
METPKYIVTEVNHPDCIALRNYAGRLAGILRNPGVESDGAAVSTLDLFAGAIHGLFLARHYGYVDRTTRVPRVDAVQILADHLNQGNSETTATGLPVSFQ